MDDSSVKSRGDRIYQVIITLNLDYLRTVRDFTIYFAVVIITHR